MLWSIFPIVGEYTIYVDLILSVLLIIAIVFFTIRFKLSAKVIIAISSFALVFILATMFDLQIVKGLSFVCVAIFCVVVSLLLTKPEKELELRHNKKVSKKEDSLSVNETDKLISNLKHAIENLSTTQTGALITIERSDDLTSFMLKSGTNIEAPVTPELLETIFYKGTPLHDGATIIRGKNILSAAVFYQPTQKPLNGKYGSRHRAAIGISEICDALTIVVSEETGKISFAYKGELISVPISQFEEKFKEYYFDENK